MTFTLSGGGGKKCSNFADGHSYIIFRSKGGGQKSKRNCGRYVWMAPSHSYAVHSSHLHNLPSGTKGGKGEGGCGKVGDHQDEEGSGGPS